MSTYQKCISALTSIRNKYPEILNEFIEWHQDGQWDDEGLIDEFTEDKAESSFIDTMKDHNIISTDEQELEIWQLLHNAIISSMQVPVMVSDDSFEGYECKETPLNASESVVVKLLSTDIKPKEKKKQIESKHSPTRKRLKKQLRIMLPKEKKVNPSDILYIEYIGYKNDNYPLLLHFVDTYVRYQLNKWILNDKKPANKNLITIQQFFNHHCNNPHFKQYYHQHNSKYIMDQVKTAIKAYQTRLLIPFQCMRPVYKIKDAKPLILVNYIFEMAKIVRHIVDNNDINIIPAQLDFMIINKDIVFSAPDPKQCQGIKQLFEQNSDDDSDDTDDEYTNEMAQQEDMKDADTDQKIAGDIDGLFKKKKLKYFSYDRTRLWMKSVDDMKKLTGNERAKRNVFVLDRRQKNDKLYLYKPQQFNSFVKNEQDLVHASLHYNSAKSMFPKGKNSKKGEDDFDVRCSLRGQMFVFSYHILSKKEIRCYLFYQGQSFRFFGEDLINVLPSFFMNNKEVEEILLNNYNTQSQFRKEFEEFCSTFTDNKFESFYHGLTNKNAQIGNIVSNDKWYYIVNKYRNAQNIKPKNNTVPVTIAPSKSKNISSRHRSSSSYSVSCEINKPTPTSSTHTITETPTSPTQSGHTSHTSSPVPQDVNVQVHVSDTNVSPTVRNNILKLLKNRVKSIAEIDDNECIAAPDGLITQYAGNNSDKTNGNNNNNNNSNGYGDSGEGNNNNNGGYNGGYSGGSGGGYSGGYGGSAGGDGDDEKGNEKDHKSEDDKTTDNDSDSDNDKEDKKEEEKADCNEDTIIDLFFTDVLSNMKDIPDNELPKRLLKYSPKVFSKVRQGFNELNKEMQRVSYALNALNVPKKKKKKKKRRNDTPEPYPSTPKNGKNIKQKKCVSNLINYNPNSIKSKYFIPRAFTEETIPNRINEKVKVEQKSVFDFMIKSLAINDKNYWRDGDKLIFNFDLHDKNDGENLYIICRHQNPLNPKNRGCEWGNIDLLNKNEIMNKYNMSLNRLNMYLPQPIYKQTQSEIFKQLNRIKYIENMLNSNNNKINIIQKTRWNKVQIYNRVNNKRRLTLSLSNPEFKKCCKTFINNPLNNIKLIPIIMFDRYEKYYVEYIWVINIDTNMNSETKHMNIGIALRYDKDKDTITVSGIHLDTLFIYKQHIVIEPSHVCDCLNTFSSCITHLHIGNPDDNINKIKDLQNRLQTLKQENVCLKQELEFVGNNNRNESIHSNTLPLISNSSIELHLANNYSSTSDMSTTLN